MDHHPPACISGSQLYSLLAEEPALRKTAPALAVFLRDLLAREKAVPFRDGYIINSLLPPMPGPAWDRFAERLRPDADSSARMFSVTWAVTNRCTYKCWHCYNAGRSQQDLPLDTLAAVAHRLPALGAVRVHLTGGDPLLRDDLEEIAGLFDPSVAVSVGSSGIGLTPDRAVRLREAGVFAVGISLDSIDAAEHDRLRGHPGAHAIALDALDAARNAGLYPYIVTVASNALLSGDRLAVFLAYARDAGASEVHLLEPCPVGRLQGQDAVRLLPAARRSLMEWHDRAAKDLTLPLLSSFAYIESPETFGCGAGSTQLYIDGSGEVSPCQWIPMSFGNIAHEPLDTLLERMTPFFNTPRTTCIGMDLNGHLPESDTWPLPPNVSVEVCRDWLDQPHPVPAFFALLHEARNQTLSREHLAGAYDEVHQGYDHHWLSEAAQPIHDLIGRLPIKPDARIFEVGCGTGYTTALLATHLDSEGCLTAADLSQGMLSIAHRRIPASTTERVTFIQGDALDLLGHTGNLDWVISTWVLGYIPLAPFFKAAHAALRPGGGLAFVVHIDGSPVEASRLFSRLAAEYPEALDHGVTFDFPRDATDAISRLEQAGFTVELCQTGAITFPCPNAPAALEHLLQSGAGTAYRDAVRPEAQDALMQQFIERLDALHPSGPIDVTHDYLTCIAYK